MQRSTVRGTSSVLLALASMVMLGAAPAAEDCPLTCTPNPSGMPGGVNLGPSGTSFSVLFGGSTSGLGHQNPCSACPGSPCTQETTVVWNNNATGWLMQYTYAGIQSAGLKQYSRGGYMTAGCDDSAGLQFVVFNPTTGAVAFNDTHYLGCECPP